METASEREGQNMNCKQNYKRLLATCAAAASLGVFGTAANAQHLQGSFTLPHAIQWGGSNFPSGVYRFETEPGGNRYVLMVRGQGRAAFVMARSAEPYKGGENALRLIRTGNKATVSSLRLAHYGIALQYVDREKVSAEETANRQASRPESAAARAVIEVPIVASGQ